MENTQAQPVERSPIRKVKLYRSNGIWYQDDVADADQRSLQVIAGYYEDSNHEDNTRHNLNDPDYAADSLNDDDGIDYTAHSSCADIHIGHSRHVRPFLSVVLCLLIYSPLLCLSCI
jgi:hypothetical protein